MYYELEGFLGSKLERVFDVVFKQFIKSEISADDAYQCLLQKEKECLLVLDFCLAFEFIDEEDFENLKRSMSYTLGVYKEQLDDYTYWSGVIDDTVCSRLLKSFLSFLKITPGDYAQQIGVPISTVKDWLSGKCLMPFEAVYELEKCLRAAQTRAYNLGSAADKADFEDRFAESGIFSNLKETYDYLQRRGEAHLAEHISEVDKEFPLVTIRGRSKKIKG